MKKFYFFIVAILVTSTMFAQAIKNTPCTLVSKDGTKIEKPTATLQQKGTRAMYIIQNFDTAPLEWEQQNTNPNPERRWFSGNPTQTPFTNIDPSSVYSACFAYNAEDCDEIIHSAPFDATGSTNLQLSFYCGYSGPWMIGGSQAGSNGADVRAVISTDDGTNWTQLWSYVETHNGTESWAWELVEINLQATYGGNPNLMIGFQYYGNDGDLGAIDAVVVKDYVAPTSPDLTVRATPQQALTPIAHATYALQANVKNVGSDLTTPQTLQISVTPGTYTDAITIPLPFVTNADSTFTSSNYFTASAIGTYTANFEVAMAGDPTPENNTSTTSFQVTEHTFGTDNGIILGGGGSNSGPLTFGNIYMLLSQDVIESYTIGWPQITENLDFTVSIYSINTTTFALTEVYTSETFTRTVAMSDTFADFEIEAQTLQAGFYLFAVNQLTATNISVGYDEAPLGEIYIWDGTELGVTSALGNVAIRVNTSSEPVTPTTCDLEALFMTSNEDPSPIGATIDIEASDTITLYPGIKNLGTDVANTYATVTFTANDQEVPSIPPYFTNPQQVNLNGLAVNAIHNIYPDTDGGLTLTPAIMDYLELTGNFELCMEVVYNGTDNEASNNKVCVTVNRAAPAATTCDLQALFMTSNTNPAPIATEITLEFNEGITLYPGIKNNGPDNANTNATITLTAGTVALINPNPTNLPLNGTLDNGEILHLTDDGMTITAAQMNQLGLGGTFDICLTVTYAGTDPDADNDTICVTVTRPTVGIEDNLASEISVYPNPAYDFVTIANAENANIVIINMLGEIVATVNNASSNQTIDISRLATGTYFVKVDGEVFKINVVK